MTVVVAAVIAASIAAGILAERRLPDGGRPVARRIAHVLFWVLTPFISFFVVARLHLTAGVGLGLVLAYAEIAVVATLAWLAATRVFALSPAATGAVVVSTLIANTGFVGVPLAGALFGTRALGPAIAFDAAVSGPMFYVVAVSIGAAFGDRGGHPRDRLRAVLLRNPPLVAVVAGLLAPASLAPDVLLTTAHVLVYVTVPLAFFMVGLTLGGEAEEGALRFPPALTAPVAVVLALRLAAAPLLMLGLSKLVVAVPHAYLLQAAMPCGVNSVVVAHAYGLDLRIAASAVAWSTILVVVAGMVVGAL